MLPTSHLFQVIPGRAKKALSRIEKQIWLNRRAVPVSTTAFGPDQLGWSDAKQLPLSDLAPNSHWGMLYDQCWRRIEIPADSQSGQTFLEWGDQGEATLYIDGEPYAGLDVAHRSVRLPAHTTEVWIESNCIQSAIWHPAAKGLGPKGSHFEGAWLVDRNEEAWAAWLDLSVLSECLNYLQSQEHPPLPANLKSFGLLPAPTELAPRHRLLLNWLDRAVDALDRQGLATMRDVLASAYSDLHGEKAFVSARLSGHAHIDLVWLWPERMSEIKAVHTFATQCRLLEQFPEMRFAYSQPASYEAVARRAPGLISKVKEKIATGQWEATGGLYVESDTQLPCGEALARSFLLGQDGFIELTGKLSKLVWLPDVFGYSGCLPQLMKLTGIEYFFTTKMTWNAINHFPFSSFVWEGVDGSEVVAHVTQGVGYNSIVSFPEINHNAEMHAQLPIHREYLHPVGFGDGGGGPTEEMAERARRMNKLAGSPEITWDQPEAFMERLAVYEEQLPVWKGECYLEYHRGTYTTHGDLKAAFRALERALQTREAVAAALGESVDLTHPWKRLVFAQFHDYIPGSSVPEVYLEGVPELTRLGEEQLADSLAALSAKNGGAVCVFNPHAAPWQGWLALEDGPAYVKLPPLSGTPITAAKQTPKGSAQVSERTLSNDRVSLTLAGDGSIEELSVDGKAILLGQGAGLPVVYPEHPSNYDAWDIDRGALSLGETLNQPTAIRALPNATNDAAIEVDYSTGKASRFTLRYSLRPGDALVRLTATVDWHEPQQLLRLEFPTAYRGVLARYGAPFGSVLRTQVPGNAYHEAQWEVPGSRWAAISHDGEADGFFIVTESKYGFSARDGQLGVSLLRSPLMVGCDAGHSGASPRALSRVSVDSPYSDQGHHVIQLALGRYAPHRPTLPHPATLADQLFTPPVTYVGKAIASPLPAMSYGPSLIPCWAKMANGGGRIVRFHEVGGQPGSLTVELAEDQRAVLTDLREQPLGDAQSGTAVFAYRPYQVVTLVIGEA